ncbi:MAG TPA: S1C family serine protease [Bryobacteraceae bacterium]|nr:S1C family serine protease [Bryobacteraceae bacterium]
MSNTSYGALQALSDDLARAVDKAASVTVAVNGRPHTPSSGIHWQEDVVVTTDHTLRQDEDITITLRSGQTHPAKLAGRDPGTDLAVLRVANLGAPNIEYVEPGSLQVGHLVLAVGRHATASLGVISSISGQWRTWRGGHVEQMIRPDVNIYVGFSGGSLVTASGAIAGINTSGLTRGGGVTLPKSTIDRVLGQILSRGRVVRGFLGIGMQPVRLPGNRIGLMILSMEPQGPAEKGGILLGDILLSADGKPLRDTDDLHALLAPEQIGRPVTFTLLRGGAEMQTSVSIGERP